MTRPLIGVMPLVDDERESLWMRPGCMDGTTRAGPLPVMLPLTADEAAVRDLSPALRPMTFSEDGLAEAVYHPDRSFLWAEQWHSEFAPPGDPCSRKLFRAFAEHAARYMNRKRANRRTGSLFFCVLRRIARSLCEAALHARKNM